MLRFDDVRHIVLKGFLPESVSLGRVPVVLKNLTPTELEIVLLSSGIGRDADTEYQRKVALVGYGLWMFDGVNVLHDRENFLVEWREFAKDLPEPLLDWLREEIDALNERAADTYKLIEPFAYTTESRLMWRALNGNPIYTMGGYPGTEKLGMNPQQELWSWLNIKDDTNEKFELNFNLAKFIVGPHISQQTQQKLAGQAKYRHEEEENRRKRILGELTDDTERGPKVARSVDELNDQLYRWIKNEKDEHDLAIDRYEAQIREEIAQRERDFRQMLERANSIDQEAEELVSPSEFVSVDEMERRIAQSRERKARMVEQIRKDAGSYAGMDDHHREVVMSKMDAVSEEDFEHKPEREPVRPEPKKAAFTPVDTRASANPRKEAYTQKTAANQSISPAPAVVPPVVQNRRMKSSEDAGVSVEQVFDPNEIQRRMKEKGLL